MGKQFEMTNKTWAIIAGVIVTLIILIAIIRPEKRDGELSLKSHDGTTTFTIENVAREDSETNAGHSVRCKVDRTKDFFSEFVRENEYFIGSINSDGVFIDAADRGETGYYIFLKNDRYFCVVNENGYAIITEMIATVMVDEIECYMPFPCETTLVMNENNEFGFTSLMGVDSYESLVEYYKRLDDDYYLVDPINKTITVHIVKEGEISDKTMMISMRENGVLVTTDLPK